MRLYLARYDLNVVKCAILVAKSISLHIASNLSRSVVERVAVGVVVDIGGEVAIEVGLDMELHLVAHFLRCRAMRKRLDQIHQPLLRWLDVVRSPPDHFLLVLELWRELLKYTKEAALVLCP